MVRVSKSKKPSILMVHAFKANDIWAISNSQSSSCSDLDSEVTVVW